MTIGPFHVLYSPFNFRCLLRESYLLSNDNKDSKYLYLKLPLRLKATSLCIWRLRLVQSYFRDNIVWMFHQLTSRRRMWNKRWFPWYFFSFERFLIYKVPRYFRCLHFEFTFQTIFYYFRFYKTRLICLRSYEKELLNTFTLHDILLLRFMLIQK